ncbi:MAG: 50S ribosomal protein L29 [Rickettsiales bacterium]|jgi:ribosomal protein L29|nr:50S ribosomal protein L29 [Rickettsiales bacterium]
MSDNMETGGVESDSELRKAIVEAKRKLLSLRLRKNGGDLKDISIFGKTRKVVARLFTTLNGRGRRNGSK